MFDEKKILFAEDFDGRGTYLQYVNDCITFTQILVIPNLTCSLRCKYCAAGNQYADRREYDPEITVNEFDKLMSVCKTRQVNIQGGEVFLYRRLPEFFDRFSRMRNIANCESVAVFTNATVIPTDEQLATYEKIDLPKKIIISNYDLPQVKIKKFIEKIKERNLDYYITPMDHFWFHPGSPKKEIGYTDEELKIILRKCTKFCRAPKLIDGKFFACGQNGYALYERLTDFIDIRNIEASKLRDVLYNYMYKTTSYDICKFCRGQFDGCELIPAAEQLNNHIAREN